MSDFLKGKLDNQEIKQRLSKHKYTFGFKPTKKLINSIIEQFWFRDFYNSFISDKIYLKYLLKYLDKIKPKKFNCYDFYKYFFDKILEKRNERNILQQIALVFEKRQSDAMTPGDYKKLLQKIESPTGKFDFSWMEKHHLGKVKERDGKELFVWEHHTITEFLTAEYILQNKNFLEEFQKLVILKQEGVVAFKPSWVGVLRFLLESSNAIETLDWLLSFLNKHRDNIDDNLSELLAVVDIKLSPQINKKIFELIYSSYFGRVVWLPVWAKSRIAKFVNKESYSRLKEDIKDWSNSTETFVKRGNVVSIVGGLLKSDSKLLSSREKGFWKSRLIDFANNPNDESNGVLQRHSLMALTYFKDDKIIPVVAQKCFEETQDSLIRDGFIQFCINSAQNSINTIDFLIKGIKKGSTIYARLGLYKINLKKAIEHLLSKISKDEEFLKAFLKHESIFDKESADKKLIINIGKQINPKIIKALKKLVFTAFRIEDYHRGGQSNFLLQIARLIEKQDSGYIFEVLNDIKKDDQRIDRLFYDSKELFAMLLTKDNVKKYFEILDGFPVRSRNDAQYAVYAAKRINGKIGEQVYQEAVKLKFIQKVAEEKSQRYFEEQESKSKQTIYDRFVKQLEPSPGKYLPSVFKYFLQNRKEIEEQWQKKDRKRLIKLALDEGLRKIDPRKFKVTIPNKETRQFSWSSVASYYGDVLSLVKVLAPVEIQKHRQHIIDFIPYAFSDDMSLIADLVPGVRDDELTFVNKVIINPKDDRRYLTPGSYIYLVGQYVKKGCKLPNVKPVLLSLIADKDIPDYEQRAAIESLAFLIDRSDGKAKEFLQNVFKKSENEELSKAANALLITVYKDEYSIDWRFAQLRRPIAFDKRRLEGIAHSIGPEEIELDSLVFANPLIELQDEKYLIKFFDLLTYSFKIIKKKRDKRYWDYVNYLWRIVIAFVENLKEKGSFKPLLALEDWVAKNATYKNTNWLTARIRKLREAYINEMGKVKL